MPRYVQTEKVSSKQELKLFVMLSDNRRITDITQAGKYSTTQIAIMYYLKTRLVIGIIVNEKAKLIRDLEISTRTFESQYDQLIDENIITEVEKYTTT